MYSAHPPELPSSPAAERNKGPILEVLRRILPSRGTVLEIASGTGQHAAYFAAALPQLTWQTSDPVAESRESIVAWRNYSGVNNLLDPVALDVRDQPWPVNQADAVVCINMIHIAPWEACVALFEGAQSLLPAGAPIFLYGPYFRDGVQAAPSNIAFDADLKQRNAQWGIRRLEDVSTLALHHNFGLEEIVEMPANNLSVTFRKHAPNSRA